MVRVLTHQTWAQTWTEAGPSSVYPPSATGQTRKATKAMYHSGSLNEDDTHLLHGEQHDLLTNVLIYSQLSFLQRRWLTKQGKVKVFKNIS